ncbi:hypothetical protein K457DRAFT_522589 [Linnemannia elongata AG-77]|uniref:Uncharacterized protein n=1 Tax=Linnemannia elongata AG-77 TaxID=1314771 RepID=A0A197JV13_9FUNG|nr:hypothetical protein K457DRAFT_522589 [Linnemannia elongata AG-77]
MGKSTTCFISSFRPSSPSLSLLPSATKRTKKNTLSFLSLSLSHPCLHRHLFFRQRGEQNKKCKKQTNQNRHKKIVSTHATKTEGPRPRFDSTVLPFFCFFLLPLFLFTVVRSARWYFASYLVCLIAFFYLVFFSVSTPYTYFL